MLREHATRTAVHKSKGVLGGVSNLLTFYLARRTSTNRTNSRQSHLLALMSNFFDRTARKVKKKVGQVVDRLRPPSQESRAASPAPSQQSVQPTALTSETLTHSSVINPGTIMAQGSIMPRSVVIPPPQLGSSAADGASSPPLDSTTPVIPVYAVSPSPPTVSKTTGSAVKELLVAVRDGSRPHWLASSHFGIYST